MIFKKQRSPMCSYCFHGQVLEDSGDILCSYKGVVSADYRCRKFSYDPFARKVPQRKRPTAAGLDFSID